MSEDGVDRGKRRFLTALTAGVGTVGIVFAATPFVLSMNPSARARAAGAPVDVDISKLELGQMLVVAWRGKPVYIVNRTKAMLAQLPNNTPLLVDPFSKVQSQQPPYAENVYRARKPEILVVLGVCTHLGCAPSKAFTVGVPSGLGANWPGGFFCHCHGSKYDMSGRVFKNVPAPLNLDVPPYMYLTDTLIRIGSDKKKQGAA